MLRRPVTEVVRHLSARGKNVCFLNLVADALQLDRLGAPRDWPDFKRAFTPSAVRRIYEAIEIVWPTQQDLSRVLEAEAADTSGLYVGFYEPRAVRTGVTRHSLYADRVLLVDPLMHPRTVREEYNPVLHPEMHRSTTLRWVSMWLGLAPWIEADLVHFIRTPGDFDSRLEVETTELTQRRYDTHPELKQAVEATSQQYADEFMQSYQRQIMLSMPDDEVTRRARELNPDWSADRIEGLLREIQHQRDADPYYVAPASQQGELLQASSGASYEMAKATAQLTGSFVMTDIPSRWKELEIDFRNAGVSSEAWSPFAKAFHELKLNYLNSVPLEAALTLRQEGRLEDMRSFLRKVWKSAASEEPFASANAVELAAELHERVREAETEWKRIDRDLLKWFGSEFAVGALALGPAIAAGGAEWAAGGVAVAGVTNLIVAQKKRADHKVRYPAAFFVRLRDRQLAK